jgi:hypothetical protein
MAIKMLIQYYQGKYHLQKPLNKKKKEAKTMAELATKCNEIMEIEEVGFILIGGKQLNYELNIKFYRIF